MANERENLPVPPAPRSFPAAPEQTKPSIQINLSTLMLTGLAVPLTSILRNDVSFTSDPLAIMALNSLDNGSSQRAGHDVTYLKFCKLLRERGQALAELANRTRNK